MLKEEGISEMKGHDMNSAEKDRLLSSYTLPLPTLSWDESGSLSPGSKQSQQVCGPEYNNNNI